MNKLGFFSVTLFDSFEAASSALGFSSTVNKPPAGLLGTDGAAGAAFMSPNRPPGAIAGFFGALNRPPSIVEFSFLRPGAEVFSFAGRGMSARQTHSPTS